MQRWLLYALTFALAAGLSAWLTPRVREAALRFGIVDNPDGTSHTTPTCIVPAASFNGKTIRTIEGHAKNGELSAVQKAFSIISRSSR